MRIILDLCGAEGAWSEPYRDAGYDVRIVTWPKNDVRLYSPPERVHGILAAPPCEHFALSGARWWKAKGTQPLLSALGVVEACLRMIRLTRPFFWCLENPVGRLMYYIGEPKMYFNPCDYGDPYTKKTGLWGDFNTPRKNPVHPTEGSRMHKLPPTADRKALRSKTPPGFAKAFFKANP